MPVKKSWGTCLRPNWPNTAPNVQVVPLNEGAAVVTYDVIIRMVHYDDETPRYQHISSIWVKQGNDWKLRFQQATAAR